MSEYVYQEYPRDLTNAEGTLREFKTKESVPPGWFTRDTGEEINPKRPTLSVSKEAVAVKVAQPKVED